MASTTLQCAPVLQVGRGWEGGCSFGGAASTPNYDSYVRAPMAVNVHQTGSAGGFEKALFSGRVIRRSLSKSVSLGGLGNSFGHRSGEGRRSFGWECRISPRALPVQAIKKLPVNVE